ncbi:MAG TPA: hypothetical protein ENJ20_06535, partial [Bacteroidetes bacterium]|nr:hypothetical protein [Bacteroidota bacterium]
MKKKQPCQTLSGSLFLYLLTVSFLSVSVFGQEVPRVVRFANKNNNSDQIWAMAQAPDGRLYFGTSDGLLVFDGSEWEVMGNSLNNKIRAVAFGYDGRLYTGSYNEFGYWQMDTVSRRFRYWSLAGNVPGGVEKREEIWHILPTSDTI